MANVALTSLARDLNHREVQGKPVRIGLIGCGEMGTDIVVQTSRMRGIKVVAIAERAPTTAFKALDLVATGGGHHKAANSTNAINAAIESGCVAVTEDPQALCRSGLIDVVVDATGVPEAGARFGLEAITQGKHLVMMNVEADVTVGPILKRHADQSGVVYSLGAGDEPSACMELIELATAMGHDIVAAGKGKNNPLNCDAVPIDYEAEARARNMNPRMLVEFVDGSKTMVEMAAIANATGLVPDIPGMHGPCASRDELSSVLIPTSQGGVLSDRGRVDFSIGPGVAPGVFVIIEADHPRILERMRDLKMGPGPFFTLFRPFHLTSLEVPLTCARAVLYGTADMAPRQSLTAEVCAVAKKDLKPGETLGQIGEYSYRAMIYRADDARTRRAIPCGLLNQAKIQAVIRKGDLITHDNAQINTSTPLAQLRSKQDQDATRIP